MFEHLCVSPAQWQFLQSSASSSSKQVTFDLSQPAESVIQYGKHRRVGEQDSGGSGARFGLSFGESDAEGESQKGAEGRAGSNSDHGSPYPRSSCEQGLLAVQRKSRPQAVLQPSRSFGWSIRSEHSHGPAFQCRPGHGAPSYGGIQGERCRLTSCEEDDLLHRGPRAHQGQEALEDSRQLGQREKEKGYPAASASNPTPGPEIHNLASDDDSWEQPTPMKKKVEKKTESP